MRPTGESTPASSAVWTIPNLLSTLRILLIPVFWALIVDPDTTEWGIVLFGFVLATDWVDGWVARTTGQVSDLGKILDPVADRLAIAAGLIALMVRGAFPMWAGVLVLARDLAVLGVGAAVLFLWHERVDVRFIGKAATFTLMTAIPAIAWGTLGYPLGDAALVVGWVAYPVGIVEYYLAALLYMEDIRTAKRAGAARDGITH